MSGNFSTPGGAEHVRAVVPGGRRLADHERLPAALDHARLLGDVEPAAVRLADLVRQVGHVDQLVGVEVGVEVPDHRDVAALTAAHDGRHLGHLLLAGEALDPHVHAGVLRQGRDEVVEHLVRLGHVPVAGDDGELGPLEGALGAGGARAGHRRPRGGCRPRARRSWSGSDGVRSGAWALRSWDSPSSTCDPGASWAGSGRSACGTDRDRREDSDGAAPGCQARAARHGSARASTPRRSRRSTRARPPGSRPGAPAA